MIRYTPQNQIAHQLFKTPFEQHLKPDNRWVILAGMLPWDRMARVFMRSLSDKGRSTVDLRHVMGALFIQRSLDLTDRETLSMISENIYMQYFVGLSGFQSKPLFDHSLLTTIRQRLSEQGARQLNEIFLEYSVEQGLIKHRKTPESKLNNPKDDHSDNNDTGEHSQNVKQESSNDKPSNNKGTIKVDATVAPQDITYPTDTKLLNGARQISELLIDHLFDQSRSLHHTKPRTYRREARKKWLGFTKKRKPSKSLINKQIKAQLGYLRRNLKHIDAMFEKGLQSGLCLKLPEDLRKKMYVISEIYRQQKVMYDDGRKKIQHRIVSISQPWVRPIVRGKSGTPVEFGAKINLSLTEGFVTVDQASFDPFHEGKGLIDILNVYKDRFGYFPQYALVDQIYLTRDNRKFLKKNNIHHTGAALGRPKPMDKNQKRKKRKKARQRNHIEGKIGQAKRKYGLDLLKTKLGSTSLCAIHLIALTINMMGLMKKASHWFIFTYIKPSAGLGRTHNSQMKIYMQSLHLFPNNIYKFAA